MSIKTTVNSSEVKESLNFYEEPNSLATSIDIKKLWLDIDKIPSNANIESDVVVKYDKVILDSVTGYEGLFKAPNNELVNAIPFNFGSGYAQHIYDADNEEIPFGLGQWFVDQKSGFLCFNAEFPSQYSLPISISFYKYTGRLAGDVLLRSDGTLSMDDDYNPLSPQSVATKKYIDDLFEKLNSDVEKIIPEKPQSLKGIDLELECDRSYNGKYLKNHTEYKVVSNESKVVIRTPYFYNEEQGTLALYINSKKVSDDLEIKKSIIPGVYGDWTVLENIDSVDKATGITNFYKELKLEYTLDWSKVHNIVTGDFMTITINFESNGYSYKSAPATLGINNDIKSLYIKNHELASIQDPYYVSGVPCNSEKGYLSFKANALWLDKFYSEKAHLNVSVLDIFNNDIYIKDTDTFEDVPYYLIDVLEKIPQNVLTDSIILIITAYNNFGEECGTFQKRFNVRIDSYPKISRVISGTSLDDTSLGVEYNNMDSLVDSNELMQIGDKICFPFGNYTQNGKTENLKNPISGPDYSGLPVINRCFTMKFFVDHYINGFYLTLENHNIPIVNSDAHILNMNAYARIVGDSESTTDWIDINNAYPGCGSPQKRDDPAMVVSMSDNNTHYITFGPTARKGWLYVRLEFIGGYEQFSNMLITF